jgi:hypothetical protein
MNVGTRHSAALGLAELCDALGLVVSEERGTISVARNGRLARLDSPQELALAVENFLSEKFPAVESRQFSLQLVRKNWLAKAASVCSALALWYLFVPGSKIIEVSYQVPIAIERLPPNLQLEAIDPPMIHATFSAPRRTFYFFDPKKIRVRTDVTLAELGRRTFPVSEEDIRYPKELMLQDFSPKSFKLSVKAAPPGSEQPKQG